ncbi:ATP-dependent DNA helicase [Candidatus Woesearchaeota archaeon]|nr:MAG: ATP-dependent DNA helicase [Candidatus Woesearchaeota archaeon]
MRYFPYDEIRPEQDRLIAAVTSTLKTKQSLVVHAPTGLGKTAATLAPAIAHALEHDTIVFFLTGRHTQHAIALETIKAIRAKHAVDIPVIDLIGKQHFCLQPLTTRLQSREFIEYCRAMKQDRQCEFFERLKKGDEVSAVARTLVKELAAKGPLTTQEVKLASEQARLCPYEIALLLAKQAKVIITDYQYLFNPHIREAFLGKLGRSLEDCILIVDEAHNLPERVKDLGSARLSSVLIGRAVAEATKYHHEELASKLAALGEELGKLGLFTDDRGLPIDGDAEKYVLREEWLARVARVAPVDELIAWCARAGDSIREEQRSSAVGRIGEFLEAWRGEDQGYTRILSRERGRDAPVLTLSYRCLDASVITHHVFNECHSAVLMSGTLTPPKMYASLLGVEEPNLLVLESPFPPENRLNIIIPKTSTKFTQRSDAMWREIAGILRKIVLAVPGNVAVFFPSYAILEQVQQHLDQGLPKTVLAEQRGMTRDEKEAFLNKFRAYARTGAVLFAVITGNYGEGVDLPGDELKGVVVVGLPLSKPDLETQALIKYFDEKFRKGWEYGYTIPAFNKTLQSAGRCIRSSTDKGVVVFLDERYEWPRYYKLFPKEWRMKSTLLFENMIKDFFRQ